MCPGGVPNGGGYGLVHFLGVHAMEEGVNYVVYVLKGVRFEEGEDYNYMFRRCAHWKRVWTSIFLRVCIGERGVDQYIFLCCVQGKGV
jgi:hypothetical protein